MSKNHAHQTTFSFVNQIYMPSNGASSLPTQELDNSPYCPVKGEIALWRAVITQALMDASSNSAKKETQYDKEQALTWLTRNKIDFNMVCDFAFFEPSNIRTKAKAAIARNCKWRADSTSSLRNNTSPQQSYQTLPTTIQQNAKHLAEEAV